MNLKQNNLEESTTDLGFVRTINENKGETIVALQKEVTLEDGTVVNVESITPSKMKQVLNSMVDGNEGAISYVTPGEPYIERDGVVQYYNDNQVPPGPVELTRLEVTQLPTKTKYKLDETIDYTGLVVKAYYNNGTIDNNYTDYIANPAEGESINGAISFGSDEAYISIYDSNHEHSTSFSLTVKTLSSLEILQLPTKTVYNVGESLDLTGLQVKATYSDGIVDDNYTDYVTEPAEGYEFGEFSGTAITIYKESLGQFGGPSVDFNITLNTEETT